MRRVLRSAANSQTFACLLARTGSAAPPRATPPYNADLTRPDVPQWLATAPDEAERKNEQCEKERAHTPDSRSDRRSRRNSRAELLGTEITPLRCFHT